MKKDDENCKYCIHQEQCSQYSQGCAFSQGCAIKEEITIKMDKYTASLVLKGVELAIRDMAKSQFSMDGKSLSDFNIEDGICGGRAITLLGRVWYYLEDHDIST